MAELDLNDVAMFVRVIEHAGFARAARVLGLPTSTVSRAVSRLEEAAEAYRAALELTDSEVEREFLARRLSKLKGSGPLG